MLLSLSLTAGATSAAHRRCRRRRPRSPPAVAPGHELHVHRGGLGVARALALDQQLLDDAGQELRARLTLARADEHGAADLVQHRRRALLVRRVDDVRLERVDGRQFLLRPLKRSCPVSCVAAIAAASASSMVASRAAERRARAPDSGVGKPSAVDQSGALSSRYAAPAASPKFSAAWYGSAIQDSRRRASASAAHPAGRTCRDS